MEYAYELAKIIMEKEEMLVTNILSFSPQYFQCNSSLGLYNTWLLNKY